MTITIANDRSSLWLCKAPSGLGARELLSSHKEAVLPITTTMVHDRSYLLL